MKFDILLGKTVNIYSKEVLIEKIDKISDPVLGTRFKVNDRISLSQMELGFILNIEKSRLEDEQVVSGGVFQKFKNRFGIFQHTYLFNSYDIDENEIKHDVIPKYGFTIFKRRYGFKDVSLVFTLKFGLKYYSFDFVFDNKDVFESGELPDELIQTKQII